MESLGVLRGVGKCIRRIIRVDNSQPSRSKPCREHKWLHEAHGRIYRKWHGSEISQQALLIYEDLPKAMNAVMIYLRTGKTRLKSCLYGIKAAETGDCRCGQDLQTVRHVVCECPLLSSRRKALLSRTILWDIRQVLKQLERNRI
jgi:hypothetical protein